MQKVASSRYAGGILPSCLVVFILVSSLLLVILTNYRQEMLSYEQTVQFYQVEVLKNLTLAQLRMENLPSTTASYSAKLYYTVGEVTYEVKEENIALDIKLMTGMRRQIVVARENKKTVGQ